MHNSLSDAHPATPKVPWNKGKLIGARLPLQTKHVWSIRTKLQLDGKRRDLAMFNLAIDSKLRGCDASPSKSRTLPRTDTRPIERQCDRRKRDCPSGSN